MKTTRSSVSRVKSSSNRCKPKEVDVYRQLRDSIKCAGEIVSSEVASHSAVCGKAWRPSNQAVWKVQYTPWDQPSNPHYVATIHPVNSNNNNNNNNSDPNSEEKKGARASRGRTSPRLPPPKDTLESLFMLAELKCFVSQVQEKFGLEPLEPEPDEPYYYCRDRRRQKIDVSALLPELNMPGLAGILFHRMMSTQGTGHTTEIDSGCWRVDPEEAYIADIAEWQGGVVQRPTETTVEASKRVAAQPQQRTKRTPASLSQGSNLLPTNKENVAAVGAGKKIGPVVSESDHSSDELSDNTGSSSPAKKQASAPVVPVPPPGPLTTINASPLQSPQHQRKRKKSLPRGEAGGTLVSAGLDPTPSNGQTPAFNGGHLHRNFYQASLADMSNAEPQSPGRQHDHAPEVDDDKTYTEGPSERGLSIENDHHETQAEADEDLQQGMEAEPDTPADMAKRRKTLKSPATDSPVMDELPRKKQKTNEEGKGNPCLNDAAVDDNEAASQQEGKASLGQAPAEEKAVSDAGHPVRRSRRSQGRPDYAEMVDGGLKQPKGTSTAGSSVSQEPSSSVRGSKRLRTRTVRDSSDLGSETTQHTGVVEDPTCANQEPSQGTRRSSRRAAKKNSSESQTCRVWIKVNRRCLEIPLEAFKTSEGIPKKFVTESTSAQPKKYALRERAALSYSEDTSEPAFEEEQATEDAPDAKFPPFVLSTSNKLSILKLVDAYDAVARMPDGACYPLTAYGNEDSGRNAVDALLKDLEEAKEKHPCAEEEDEEILAEQQLFNRTRRVMQGRRSQEQSMRYKEKEQAENEANIKRQQQWINKKKAPKIDDIEWEEIVDRPIQFAATRTMRRARIHGSDSCPCTRKTTRNATRDGEDTADHVCRLCFDATNADAETRVPTKSIMPFCVFIDTDAPAFLERDADPTEDDQKKEAEEPEKKGGTRASKRKQFDSRKRRETIMKLSELQRSMEFAEQYNSGLLDKMTAAGV